jgi:Ras family protein A
MTIERLRRQNQEPMSLQDGMRLAREFGAAKDVGCSSLTGEGVRNVFD